MRRGGELTRFTCFSVVVSCCRVVVLSSSSYPFLSLFFMNHVWNNDFGVFLKSPEAGFRSGSLPKAPASHIGHQRRCFQNKTVQKGNAQRKTYRPENQDLGPKLCRDESPSLNNIFPMALELNFVQTTIEKNEKQFPIEIIIVYQRNRLS